MKLTVIIREVADGHMELQVEELPGLEVVVEKFKEIPEGISIGIVKDKR